MSFKEQLIKLKENWLIIVLVVIAFLIFTMLSSGVSMNSYRSMDSIQGMSNEMYDSSYRSPAYGSSSQNDFAPEIEERKITKNSRLSLEVNGGDFFSSTEKINNIVSSSNSFITTQNISSRESGKKNIYSGSFTIKVEASKLDAVVLQLKEIGKVTSFNEGTNDITGGYNNTMINLNLEKEKLSKYQQLYLESTDVEMKMNLIDRIFNQERTVKYLEDSLKNMDQKVEYSTVSLTLSEKYKYSNVVLVKISDLVKTFINSLNTLLKLIFVVLPFAVAGYLIYLIFRKKREDVTVKKK